MVRVLLKLGWLTHTATIQALLGGMLLLLRAGRTAARGAAALMLRRWRVHVNGMGAANVMRRDKERDATRVRKHAVSC